MRTIDETVQRFLDLGIIHTTDFFGFQREVLITYIPDDKLAEIGIFTNSEDDSKTRPIDFDSVHADVADYMEFAWGKVMDHRGLSASRSIIKMSAWMWLLEDEELYMLCHDDSAYPQYGAPILMAVCSKYDIPYPEYNSVLRMAGGKPCTDGCEMGCGQVVF
jgi:hypothetical protein